MKDLSRISLQLRQHFQDHHYVLVPQALPVSLIERWRSQAAELQPYARTVKRLSGKFQLSYRVVTGDIIRNQWPELFAFYRDLKTIEWIKELTGEPHIYISSHFQSAVNLNIMDSGEATYRWHFDAVPYTALLYLTDVVPEVGGALHLVPNCKPHVAPELATARIVRLWPTAGSLLLMDGTRTYHRVSNLLRPTTRFSIPLVYPKLYIPSRPTGLDAYLYEEAA